jgi:hypothetical protein
MSLSTVRLIFGSALAKVMSPSNLAVSRWARKSAW